MIAMEIVMAYFEFWTMALLTIPLLTFGVIPQLKFLADKSIGAMFNLAGGEHRKRNCCKSPERK